MELSTLAGESSTLYKNELIKSQSFLKKFIRSKIINKSDVLDVLQEVNKVLIQKESGFNFDQFDEPNEDTFQRWACGIARFQIMAFYNKSKRNRIIYVDEFHDKNFILEDASCPLFHLFAKDSQFNCLNLLSTRERNIIALLYYGYKQIEISKILNIHPPHISLYKKNAFLKIRNYLNE